MLDLTQIYQGPYCTFLMAQAGAEVIKIEPPGGERLRPPPGARGSMAFAMLNANAKMITGKSKRRMGPLLVELAMLSVFSGVRMDMEKKREN